MQQVDSDIIKRIFELYEAGVRSVKEMETHLQIFVKTHLFAGRTPPEITNRRYFPTKCDIKNHMYRAAISQRLSAIDQEDVSLRVEAWKEKYPTGSFLFRPSTLPHSEKQPSEEHATSEESGDANDDDVEITPPKDGPSSPNTLLFVYQTEWQKKMLIR